MNRRRAIRTMALLAGSAYIARATGQGKPRLKRIGFHGSGSAQSIPRSLETFRKGMAERGWVEGRDYFLDARYADNRGELIDAIAAELVAAQPDLLLATGDTSARALARKTKTIPIVFIISSDPIGSGYAATLVRPGRNMTGLTSFAPDLAAKRLQLLREALPALSHVGLLFNPAEPQATVQVNAYQETGARLGIRITPLELKQSEEAQAVISRGADQRIEALALTQGPLINTGARVIAQTALAHKLPTIAPFSRHADDGILLAYAPHILENFRLAAGYADRILKGAKPAELAIEQPSKFELAVNAKTARAIGVKMPRSILVRADRVIE